VYFRWRRLGNAVLPQQQVADALQAEVRCSLLPLASRQTVCSLGPSVSDEQQQLWCSGTDRTPHLQADRPVATPASVKGGLLMQQDHLAACSRLTMGVFMLRSWCRCPSGDYKARLYDLDET
jgi:hypothetical protein